MGTQPPRPSDRSATDSVEIPHDLESPRSKLIYLFLSERGESTASELCERLQLDKGTVLVITKTLKERGYLEYEDGVYRLT